MAATKTVRVKWNLSIGFATANREDVVEVVIPDGLTPAQEEAAVEDEVRDQVFDYIEWGFHIIRDRDDDDA